MASAFGHHLYRLPQFHPMKLAPFTFEPRKFDLEKFKMLPQLPELRFKFASRPKNALQRPPERSKSAKAQTQL